MPSFRCLIAECCFAVVEVLLKKVTTITTTTATTAAAAAAVFQLLDGTNTSCIRRDELSVVALPSHLVATPFFFAGLRCQHISVSRRWGFANRLIYCSFKRNCQTFRKPVNKWYMLSQYYFDRSQPKQRHLQVTMACVSIITVGQCRSGLVVSAPTAVWEEDQGSNVTADGCVYRECHSVLGTGCAPLLQCLGQLSLASLRGH